MLPSGQEAAEAFYRVIDAAYEKRSVALTSNLHPAGFDTIMPKTLATAAVDRFLHHAHMFLTEAGRFASPKRRPHLGKAGWWRPTWPTTTCRANRAGLGLPTGSHHCFQPGEGPRWSHHRNETAMGPA